MADEIIRVLDYLLTNPLVIASVMACGLFGVAVLAVIVSIFIPSGRKR